MTPLGMFGLAAVAAVALPDPRSLADRRARRDGVGDRRARVDRRGTADMEFGAHVAVFGLFLSVPILVMVAVAGREASWTRAIGWFEFLYLLPLLLGLAGLLAQPACFAGNPPAPMPR